MQFHSASIHGQYMIIGMVSSVILIGVSYIVYKLITKKKDK